MIKGSSKFLEHLFNEIKQLKGYTNAQINKKGMAKRKI